MARTKISEFSATPGDNTDIDGIDIAEGCAPSGINNAIRELMAQLKDMQTGSSGDTFTLTTVNSTTVDTTNLEATNLKAKDGTAAGSIANSTGVVTLASSVLTTTDINGGTVDGAVIGGASAAAVSSTNLAYTGTLTGGTGVVNLGSGQVYKDASGNVGIGTSSPNVGLTVSAKAVSAGYVVSNVDIAFPSAYSNGFFRAVGNYQVGSGVGGTIQLGGKSYSDSGINAAFLISAVSESNATDALTFSTQTSFNNVVSEKMRIASSGNVGIDTSSPAYRLQVRRAGGAGSLGVSIDGVGSVQRVAQYFAVGDSTSATTGHAFYTRNGTATDNLAALIDSTGSLLVGTTSSTTPHTSGVDGIQLSSTALISICRTSDSLFLRRQGSNGGVARFYRDGTNVGSIDVTTTATSYVTSSDYRLKENVQPMQGALATVAALKPVTYKWKVDGSSGQGFIAHELQAVVPDCVTGEKDGMRTEQYEISPAIPAVLDEEGSVITEAVEAVMGEREMPSYQGVDTSFLVATLTAAIQEQQALITDLTTRLTALESS